VIKVIQQVSYHRGVDLSSVIDFHNQLILYLNFNLCRAIEKLLMANFRIGVFEMPQSSKDIVKI